MVNCQLSIVNDFFQAAQAAIDTAVESGRVYYVYAHDDGYTASSDWAKGWLFCAYPGGRKVLSVAGKRIAEEAAP